MDPYKILGVSPNASDEEIKQAYRALAKKYHPDNYVNNPIADLAAEKMKEINTAYDQIMKMRSGQAGNSADFSGGGTSGNSQYATIRAYIAAGNLGAASAMLENMTDRNAEWYFLKGSILYRYGRYDQAREFFRIAHDMDPSNPEYTESNARMDQYRTVYRTRGGYGRESGSDACDCCSSLILADCCCECMGGDLIGCC